MSNMSKCIRFFDFDINIDVSEKITRSAYVPPINNEQINSGNIFDRMQETNPREKWNETTSAYNFVGVLGIWIIHVGVFFDICCILIRLIVNIFG